MSGYIGQAIKDKEKDYEKKLFIDYWNLDNGNVSFNRYIIVGSR